MPPTHDRRAVLTGLGVHSPLGAGLTAYWDGLLGAGAVPREIDMPHLNMAARRMYLTPGDAVPDRPTDHAGVTLAPAPRMAVAAACEALADAGVADADAVVVGVETGNAAAQEALRGPDVDAAWSPLAVTAAAVADAVGTRGAAISVGNACAAGGYALGTALDMIRAGEVDAVLVGGAEGVTRAALGGFDRIGVTDPRSCRPFARDRAGTVFGDGAAFVLVESADRAAARGARVYAELAGVAWSCDALHPIAPDPAADRLVRAMHEALADAGLGPEGVGCVIPHATGTPAHDVVESRALRRVFGDAADRTPVLALKARIGHTSGAAGMLACVAGALIVSRGQVPANVAVDQDPECDVWLPQGTATGLARPAVLVNCCATGGNNASFVLRPPGGSV